MRRKPWICRTKLIYMKMVINLFIFALIGIATWYLSLKYIDKDWHLLIGYLTFSFYYAVFDLIKIIEKYE